MLHKKNRIFIIFALLFEKGELKMKKSKLSITLVTSFIAAMAMTACSSVKPSQKAVVTFTPYGAKDPIAIYSDDVYEANRNNASGVTKFYDKVLEVLIRYSFNNKTKPFVDGEMKYDDIKKWADNQVQEQKDKANSNAKSNGTKYEDELKAILDSNNVEDVKELKEKFIYDKEKEVMKNWYADVKADELKEEFIGIKNGATVDGNVPSAMPYHVRHILIKVDQGSDSNSKFYKETISESQAKLLSDTVTTLAEGKFTFDEVAQQYSEDTSASNGGDVGIMTNAATSGSLGMVNEFQLGLYAYDNLYAGRTDNDLAKGIKANLGITADVSSKLGDKAVEVPYEAFVKLGEYADITADKEGNKIADGSDALYPRNIIWNKYFNLHNVFVIKNSHKASYDALANPKDEFATLAKDDTYDANLNGFNATSKYLQDEKGRVIVGVRSQFGIHLMVIQKSIYDENLAEYYQTKITGDEVNDKEGKTYVTYIQSSSLEDYRKRADDVKSKITSFDSTYDYRLYDYLKGEYDLKFADDYQDIGKNIDSYIQNTRDSIKNDQKEGLEKVWRTYTELLSIQDFNRTAEYKTYNTKTGEQSGTLTRLVPEAVADAFYQLHEYKNLEGDDLTETALKSLYEQFKEGGDYYYYA